MRDRVTHWWTKVLGGGTPFLLGVIGCSEPPPGCPLDVTGGWVYQAAFVAQGFQGLAGVTLQLTQSDDHISGTYQPIEIDLLAPNGDLVVKELAGGPIANGSVADNRVGCSITFDFAQSDWRHTGTVLGNTADQAVAMQGVFTVEVDLGPPWGTVAFTSNGWQAAR